MKPESKQLWVSQAREQITKLERRAGVFTSEIGNTEGAMQSHHGVHIREGVARDRSQVLNDLDKQRMFVKELMGSEERVVVEPGAVVELSFSPPEEDRETMLYMNTKGTLPDVEILTPESPLGEAVKGKTTGDTVSYKVNGREFDVSIYKIE